jgi:hypothetical protein
MNDPRGTQQQILRRYIAQNAQTGFGKQHHFEQIDSIDSFRRRVPLRNYDELTPWIDRIAAGDSNILTAEPVLRLTPTSGSTRARKLIPFTAGLQREFNLAISPWMADLFRSDPALALGCAYWSITPATSADEDFEEDAAYLGGWRQRLVDAILAVPSRVRHIADIDRFRHATMRHLLARADLRLISVWHPSFLELLLDYGEAHWKELCEEVASGACGACGGSNANDPRAPLRYAPGRSAAEPGDHRATYLRNVGRGNWCAVWRHLALVSCWTDAHAAGAAQALSRRLPHVRLQPKGLLATEGFVTIPFGDAHPLAVRSHFVEFLTKDGRSLLADELTLGETYSLALTTAGGLYRYRLGDRVEVVGKVARTPSLRFVGRVDHVVDRFGEKLSEGFVANAIRQMLAAMKIETPFAMLAPCNGFYTLYVESHGALSPQLAEALEQALRANPHYAYCRNLGQLAPAAVFRIERNAYPAYAAALFSAGVRLGDIKPAALSGRSDWSKVFAG